MSEKENIREIILIGRGAESNFIADDSSVSRQHAQIIDYGTYYTVVDLGSTNGTFVNGKRVDSETPLHKGDQLKAGNVVVPWEQLVQPPQKSKKPKVLLAILIPVIALLMIGGGAAGYFIWWRSRVINDEVNQKQQETVKELAQQINENEEKARQLEEQEIANRRLENQKDVLNAQKEEAIKAKAEADKDKEKAQQEVAKAKKEAEKAKEEAAKAQKEAEKAKKEAEKAKKEAENTSVNKSEDKKKQINDESTKTQELKSKYEKLKTTINGLKEAVAWDVSYDLGMSVPKNVSAKPELLKEAAKAYNSKDADRLNEIEKAIKKNTK